MKLGKVNLRNEAHRPGAIADVSFGLPRAFPPLQRLFPSLRAKEPVEPMAGPKENMARHRTSIDPFRLERRPQRPVDVRWHVRLATKTACAQWTSTGR